jgi:hypothetical protein
MQCITPGQRHPVRRTCHLLAELFPRGTRAVGGPAEQEGPGLVHKLVRQVEGHDLHEHGGILLLNAWRAGRSVAHDAVAEHGKPEIISSDQGSPFISDKYQRLFKPGEACEGVRISTNGKCRANDHVFIEPAVQRAPSNMTGGSTCVHPRMGLTCAARVHSSSAATTSIASTHASGIFRQPGACRWPPELSPT